EFRVTFSGMVSGYAADVQSVTIVPLSDLPPETDIIQPTRDIPDPASEEYLVVSQTQNPTQELFNGSTSPRTTYNVQITGKTVVFDSSSPLYGQLYTRFNNRADLRSEERRVGKECRY